jgi:radical SAM protein with 4Fe4S-binding SPASM domain
MNFYKVHVELTNICGLSCSFCPPKTEPNNIMILSFFESVLKQLVPYTKLLAFHLLGDALTLSNLKEYLDMAQKYSFSVELTTSGYFLKNHDHTTLFHPAVKQLNISLNSFNKNSTKLSFDEYIKTILELSHIKIAHYPKPFINLRLWNLDEQNSDIKYNELIYEKLKEHFSFSLTQERSIRVAPKILLNFDNYFEWPSLSSDHNTNGFCHGLSSHFGILSSGAVVPCCLDSKGIIPLGNLHGQSLDEILKSQRVENIRDGFSHNIAIEELCKKCSYKDRFEEITKLLA